jgi:hypothetical protein
MNDGMKRNTVPCGNYEALVAYLYDECEPAERDAVAAHLAQCASCAEEVEGLRGTRAHLSAWTPPALPLGFQITRTEDTPPSNVLRPAAWWRRPLPAWAQVAAAALIFAAGMGVSGWRSTPAPAAAPMVASQQQPVVATPAVAAGVSRGEVARLEARLRSVENAQAQRVSVALPRTAAGAVDERALLASVSALMDEKISQSNIRLISAVSRELEAHRGETTQRMGLMDEELQDARRAIVALPGLAVRTSLQTGGR